VAGGLEHFLRRARRRHLLQAVLEQAALAACAAVATLLLLLILGTQILNWYWPVLLFVAALVVGGVRLRRRIPGMYGLAQAIDTRLAFRDSLSTAYHFRGAGDSGAVALQRREAERLAADADLAFAVPARAPRSLYLLAGLFAAAATLFAMRYLVTRSLDLRAPIAQLHLDSFDEPKAVANNRKSAVQERLEEQLKQLGMGLDPVDEHPGLQDPPIAPEGVVATPDGKAPIDSAQKAEGNGTNGDMGPSGPEGDEKSQAAGNQPGGKDGAPMDLPGLNLNGKKGNEPSANRNGAQNGQQSSMLDKMRDAMANLMAKLNLKPPAPQGQQGSNNGQSNGNQMGAGQKGASQAKTKGEGREQGSPNGESDSESGEQAQAGAGKGNERGGDKPGGQDSKTGMGKQDGNKDLVDAEQLAAMGKISEIIGKRSAQLTGEMTVEVPSGKQQLKTAYTRKHAAHGDTGGEISREEIPLQLQPYVQRYFEEIHKLPVAAPRTEPPPKTPG